MNTDKKLKGDAKRMVSMIDDNTITVNLITTDKNETSAGNLMIGGAFMGNTFMKDAEGNVKSNVKQAVRVKWFVINGVGSKVIQA